MSPDTTRAIFRMDGYCVRDPSPVTDEEGKHHLFFSRCAMKLSRTGRQGHGRALTSRCSM